MDAIKEIFTIAVKCIAITYVFLQQLISFYILFSILCFRGSQWTIDITIVVVIPRGLPLTEQKLYQLVRSLRVAFKKAGLRIRYNATEHEQTRNRHLRVVQESTQTSTVAKIEMWAMRSRELALILLWPGFDFSNVEPLTVEDEKDRAAEDSLLESTGTTISRDCTV